MRLDSQEKEYMETKTRRDRCSRFVVACFFIVIPYLCSQSFICDILAWANVDRYIILSIQVWGSVLFSAFSVVLTKDFNFFYGLLNKFPVIKKTICMALLYNCKIVWGVIGIVLKILFFIGKSNEGYKEVDNSVDQMIEDYRRGTAVSKAGLNAILAAFEGGACIYICGIVHYEMAVVISHIIGFIASLMGLVLVISAIWEFVYKDDNDIKTTAH